VDDEIVGEEDEWYMARPLFGGLLYLDRDITDV
jgi:hypothetical protein